MPNYNYIKYLMSVTAAAISLFLCSCASARQEPEAPDTGGGALHYYIWNEEEAYIREVVEAWNAKKGREDVILHVINNADYSRWLEEYTASGDTASSDAGADIMGLRGNSNVIMMSQKGCLCDLGPYIKKSQIDISAYGNMFKEIMDENKIYAMPARSTCWALYYNKEIFDRAGLPYPGSMSWDRFMELAGEVKAECEDVLGGVYPSWVYNMSAIQKGYYLIDDDLEPARENLELLNRLYTSEGIASYGLTKEISADAHAAFERGDIAMFINGEWMAQMLLADSAQGINVPDWDIAPLPTPEEGGEHTLVGQYQFAGISASCKRPGDAFEFLEFLCGYDGAKLFASQCIIPAFLSPEIMDIYREAVGYKNGAVFFEGERIQEQVMWRSYDEVIGIFNKYSDRYLEGAMTLDEAMENFDIERKRLYEEWR